MNDFDRVVEIEIEEQEDDDQRQRDDQLERLARLEHVLILATPGDVVARREA